MRIQKKQKSETAEMLIGCFITIGGALLIMGGIELIKYVFSWGA